MTVFDDLFQGIGLPALLEMHGESVEYHPRSGRPRTITMIVDRSPPGGIDEATGVITPRIIATGYDDTTTGIAFSEIDTGGDKLKLAWRKGGKPERRDIVNVSQQVGGIAVEVH